VLFLPRGLIGLVEKIFSGKAAAPEAKAIPQAREVV
jgi:hypothetical protein